MLNVDDVNFIKKWIPFYAHLHFDEQNLLIQSMSRKVLAKGEQITKQIDDCKGLFVLESGRIRAFIMSPEGKEITLFRLLEKDICIMSASCLFKNLHFSVYLEVEKPSTIFLIPPSIFEEISQNNIYIKEYIMESISLRFSSAMMVFDQAVFGSLSKRVASFILEQTLLEDSSSLSITHEMIAKNIGSAREAVSRMLKQFERDQIINTSRGTIAIHDLEKLKDSAK